MKATNQSPAIPRKEFTLRVPMDVWTAVERASAVLSMAKSQFCVKSIRRNLQWVEKNEIPIIQQDPRIQEALCADSSGGVR